MRLALLIAFTALACDGGITIYIDPAFTPDERQAITDAAEDWRHTSGGGIVFDLIDDRAPVGETKMWRWPLAARSYDKCVEPVEAPRCLAVGRRSMHAIYVDADEIAIYEDPTLFRDVIKHEFGHSVGFPADHKGATSPSVMIGTIVGAPRRCITRADIEFVCRIQGCMNLPHHPCD